MWYFCHLVARAIEKLVGLWSSFYGSGFSSERPVEDLILGNSFQQIFYQSLPNRGTRGGKQDRQPFVDPIKNAFETRTAMVAHFTLLYQGSHQIIGNDVHKQFTPYHCWTSSG